METLKLTPFDAAKYLTDTASQTELLDEAFASGDPSFIAVALGTVARARGMTELASETGIKRPSLYRALSKDGNPTLETMTKVLDALGLQLAVRPAKSPRAA